ncbi:MAG: cytochrome P450 [Acidimicrobiia bacterium]
MTVTTDAAARPTTPFDVCDPAFYLDPWDKYRWLRENAPVAWDEKNQVWVVSTFEGVFEVSRDADTWISGEGIRPVSSVDLSLIGLDGEQHTRQRRLINKGFTPRAVGNLEQHVRDIADEVIDSIAGKTTGDFVPDVAIHVPLIVIAELMGLPMDDREQFWRWSDAMMGGEGAYDPVAHADRMEKAAVAFTEYTTLAAELVAQRRAEYAAAKAEAEAKGEPAPPARADDLISVLVAAHDDGVLSDHVGEDLAQLDDAELLMFLVLLVVAGNETTRNAMSGGMIAFSRNPEQWELFKANVDDPEFTHRAADEIARYVSPVLNFVRTATKDTVLLGQPIAKGEKVLLMYQSANRDATAFDAPDEFRIDRQENAHLAFGIGPHFCLGANLARLEIRVVFEELARKLPAIRMTEGAVPVYTGTNTLVHGVDSIPVTYR